MPGEVGEVIAVTRADHRRQFVVIHPGRVASLGPTVDDHDRWLGLNRYFCD